MIIKELKWKQLILIIWLSFICTSNGQIISSTITSFRDARIGLAKHFLSQLNTNYLDEDENPDEDQTNRNSFGTIVATSMGPVSLPYSIDYTDKLNVNLTYDYIIVGGGSAGSVLAARLTEDLSVRVLLIEAGGNEDLFSTTPVFAFLQQKTQKDWAFQSTPQKYAAFGLKGNRIPAPQGKVVGGGSSINYLLFVRGNRLDYDRWEKLGAKGWNYSSLSPYFLKMEGSRDSEGDPGYHGTTGPITVTPLQKPFPVDKAFIEGVSQLNLTLGDYNGAEQERWQYTRFTIRDGRRCSAGRGYLGPASHRSNLQILLHATVTKITFENKVATGVELITRDGKEYQVLAGREVILATGAINTPKLLMLSGIGPRDQLDKFGIPIVHESPGVGANLQDHPFSFQFFTTRFGTSLVLPRATTALSFAQYSLSQTGSLASPGLDIIGFWKSPYAPDTRPDIQIHQLAYIAGGAFPDLILGPIFNFDNEVLYKYLLPYSGSDGTMFAVTLVRPRSIGSVTLASGDFRDDPIVDYNMFADSRDLDALVAGCKLVLNITQTPAMQAIDTKSFSSQLKDCSKYQLNSDEYLRCSIQTMSFTLYHPTGTAKMGSRDDPMAVVDSNLRLIGVDRCRVVNSAIMPEVPTGNTNAPTITVAERAADLIKGRQLRPRSLPIKDESALYDYVPIEN